jgi:ubiquinone/menaquinone biosynthesis C-methylase UbiE
LSEARKVLPGWASNLKRLRGVGVSRSAPSTAYAALKGKLSRGSVLLDIGCGDSNDRIIAAQRGVVAYGVDLFVPIKRSTKGFIKADARRLPFESGIADAVNCQALVALIPPDDRYGFYVEVARVLKPRGLFSIVVCPLTDGWRVKSDEELQRILAADFVRVSSCLYQRRELL